MKVQPATHVNLHELLPSDVAMRSLNTGQTLLAAGDLPSAVWLIKSGSLRSLAALPPQNNWRTVQRHRSGELVGWLGWLHNRPIEHLRAAEPCELVELSLNQVDSIWRSETVLRDWCAAQTPTVELLHVLLHLSHGNPARGHQLDDWRELQHKTHRANNQVPEPRAGGQWFQLDDLAARPR